MKFIKYLLICFIILICSCQSQQKFISLTDDMNKSIIDGFYNNDTTNISKSIYLVR